jgi:secreted trypsin-like serine protease
VRRLLLTLVLALALPAPAQAIVGGQVTPRDWPWMTALEAQRDGEWAFRCGSSLLYPDVVLTAAHCVDTGPGTSFAPGDLRILAGTKKRSAGGDRVGTVQVVEHPRFDSTNSYDVALLKLARPVAAGGTIRLAQPPEAGLWAPGREATVIGWGAEVPSGPSSDDLKEASVPIRSDSECGMFNPDLTPEAEVCAGNLTGGEDACQGDSGGPLMVPGGSGWLQVGVVSHGLGCAFPTQYGVYAEAAGDALRPWIESTARSLTSGRQVGSVAATPGTAPSGAAAPSTRITLPRRLGSARAARRRGRLRITLRTTGPLRSISARVRRGRRTVASGRRRSLRRSRGRVGLRVRRGLRRGRATLVVTARDTTGRRLVAARRVTLRR